MRKTILLIALALLIALPALASGDVITATPPAVTATQQPQDSQEVVSMNGSGAVLQGNELFMVLDKDGAKALFRVPLDGGEPSIVDSAEEISDLVLLSGNLYYLRKVSGQSMICVRKEDGTRGVVTTFAASDNVRGLSAYKEDMLVIVNEQLHIVYPGNGLALKLVGARMSEYVVVGDYAYYAALSDAMDYETPSLTKEGETITGSAGCLYYLNLVTATPSRVLKAGVYSLKYQNGKLYFHNLSDNYVMGSSESEWIEGKLYSYDLATGTLAKLQDGYDWGFFTTKDGTIVYTYENLALVDKNPASVLARSAGGDQSLYTPEVYATLAGVTNAVAVYEPTLQQLTLVYPDGSTTKVYSGDLMAAKTELGFNPTPSTTETPSEEGDPSKGGGWFTVDGSGRVTVTNTALPSAGGTSSGSKTSSTSASTGTSSGTGFKDATAAPSTTSGSSSGWTTTTAKPSTTASTSTKKPSSGGSSSSSSSTKKPSSTPNPKATDSSYIFPTSSTKKLTKEDVLAIPRNMWGYARNEIWARHGYQFKTKAYADYFSNKTWYKPGGYNSKDVTDIEWYNMDLIKALEKQYPEGSTPTVTPTAKPTSSGTDGSYIFPNSNTKKLTKEDILGIPRDQWGYARNEILARHGYTFKTEKYGKYFAGKSWYKAGGYKDSSLNDIEWYNVDLIKALEKEYPEGSTPTVKPTSTPTAKPTSSGTDNTYVFPNSNTKKLTKEDVLAIPKDQWGYARNEILARHGYTFKTEKYSKYFASKSWYTPGGYKESSLSDIEWYNVNLIKSLEKEYGLL